MLVCTSYVLSSRAELREALGYGVLASLDQQQHRLTHRVIPGSHLRQVRKRVRVAFTESQQPAQLILPRGRAPPSQPRGVRKGVLVDHTKPSPSPNSLGWRVPRGLCERGGARTFRDLETWATP